jgi:hypothetical protein
MDMALLVLSRICRVVWILCMDRLDFSLLLTVC